MKSSTGYMAPVTPAQIDEEINKYLASLADLRAQKNLFRQMREAAATKGTVAPREESLAESGGSFKMSVLLEPLGEPNPKKGSGEDTVASGGSKERPLVVRPDTHMSAKRKRPVPEPEEGEEEDPDATDHNPPCDLCAKADKPCRGVPDRTCFRCTKLKSRCNKSRGRGGKGSGNTTKAPVPDTKGKAPVRVSPWDLAPSRKAQAVTSSSSVQGQAETPLDLIIIDDDNETPRKRTGATSLPSNMVADTKRAILALESKILTTRGYLKDLQGRVSTSEDLVISMQSDLDRVKSLVERLGN